MANVDFKMFDGVGEVGWNADHKMAQISLKATLGPPTHIALTIEAVDQLLAKLAELRLILQSPDSQGPSLGSIGH